jgi:hypothetical protein
MASEAANVLGSLQPVLQGDNVALVKDETDAVLQQSPGLNPYDAIKTAIEHLVSQNKIAAQLDDRLSLALEIAKLTNNNRDIIKAVDQNANVNSVRDFAVHFDTAAIQKTISPSAPGTPSTDAATAIRTAVFKAAPTATVQGMVMNDKVKLTHPDPKVKADVVNVLSKLDVNVIGTKPVSSLPKASSEAFAAVPAERMPAVINELKTLSRVASIAPTTTAMRGLVNQGLTTSLAIANVPKENFMKAVASIMTPEVASEVHANAVNTNIRNENALIGLLQLVRGTGLQAIDGQESPAFRQLQVEQLAATQSLDLNFGTLFGGMDQCVCDDCTTVYSAASYFVDLLQYLRQGSINQDVIVGDNTQQGQQPSIAGTVLEKLFKRRPDLGNLQLTCENTNADLPYIDLANEVMESYVINLDTFAVGAGDVYSRQVDIDVYNVGEDEDSNDLLAQPQNTNYNAYQTLAAASYPLTLPYHQPIDAQRAFLNFLKVPRLDLLKVFLQKPPPLDPKVYGTMTAAQSAALQDKLNKVQNDVLNRQLDAETLGLVQEQYLILTGEVFFAKEYFEVTENITPALTPDQYQSRISLLPPCAYWGYSSADALTSQEEEGKNAKTGLQFIKSQFLPRSGVTYDDLVKMVETTFLNPQQPQGRTKTIFDELQFSYRFLQTLVDNQATDPKRRLGKLAEFLVQTTNVIRLAELLYDETSGSTTTSKSSNKNSQPGCVADGEVRNWVFNNFESLGKVIVLDSGEGPRLPVEGQVVAKLNEGFADPAINVGYLSTDGTVKDANGKTVGNVDIGGRVMMGSAVDGITINDQYKYMTIQVQNASGTVIAIVQSGYLMVATTGLTYINAQWVLTEGMGGSCEIDNVRLIHLDGTSLTIDEWANFQKFIRLWRILGWSVSDTDMALMGLNGAAASPPSNSDSNITCGCKANGTGTLVNGDNALITFNNFTHGTSSTTNGTTSTKGTSRTAQAITVPEITTDTIHQLADIKKLLPLTGLPVEQLLTFWTSIPTQGSKSLYSRLFFGSIIDKTDPVFGPDANGDYFTGSQCKISDNILVILAAFGMKTSDISYLLNTDTGTAFPLQKPIPDVLNIENLSLICRYGLIAKVLGVGIPDMGQVLAGGFPDPFNNPSDCLDLLETWNKMTDEGFSWAELRYVADDIPSPIDPLAPSMTTVLQTAKTLHDGLLQIQQDHQVPKSTDTVTDDMVQAQAALIFDDAIVTEILQLLNGTTGTWPGGFLVGIPQRKNRVSTFIYDVLPAPGTC